MKRSLAMATLAAILAISTTASAWTERCDVAFSLSGASYSQVEWRTHYYQLGDFEGGGSNVVCTGPNGGSGGCTENNVYNTLRCDVTRRPFLPAPLAVCSFYTDDPEAAIAGMTHSILSAQDTTGAPLSSPFAGSIVATVLTCD